MWSWQDGVLHSGEWSRLVGIRGSYTLQDPRANHSDLKVKRIVRIKYIYPGTSSMTNSIIYLGDIKHVRRVNELRGIVVGICHADIHWYHESLDDRV